VREDLHTVGSPGGEEIGVMRLRSAEDLYDARQHDVDAARMSIGSAASHAASIRITAAARKVKLRTRVRLRPATSPLQ